MINSGGIYISCVVFYMSNNVMTLNYIIHQIANNSLNIHATRI